MSKSHNAPILVTGSHRSGSTWTGRMIALSPETGFILEPFNIRHKPGFCAARFDNWYTYVCKENEHLYARDLENCLRFKYSFKAGFKAIKKPRNLLGIARDYMRFESYRLRKKRPLVKDPIALFSAEWLAERFDMDVIVLIRHPAAFAGSLKKGSPIKEQWDHPFDHFLKQPLLMDRHLAEFRSEIEEYARKEQDIIDQAILLWNLVHHMILKYQQSQPGWIFMKHEDLSEHPIERFAELYRKLGLELTESIERKIREHTSSREGQTARHLLKRDSKSNVWMWKKRLTREEIARVKERTREIAGAFYTEADW